MAADRNIEDLQSVSQHVLATTDRMHELESEKRTVEAGSPRFVELSDEIEKLAGELRAVSASESDIAAEIQGTPGLPTIEEADHAAASD
jgi:hypothetical protein